ncbi:MAG: DinB family protein [Anaerolineales bacterium]|nr:DinB family protein [Anaerolineales bacterium]
MTLTLLLDLDDTLLDTNLPAFMPAYFQSLADHVCGHVSSDKFLRALISGVNRMNDNEDPRLTLREVFDAYFFPALDIPQDELQDVLDDFYEREFPKLASHTSRAQGAVEFVDWATNSGFQIAIATDPLFPLKATHHRLRWAGFDPEQFGLVSAFEEFHFTKSHPAYYAEILGSLGWQDSPVLMAGNDVHRDIFPAQELGLKTFLVGGEPASPPDGTAGSGSLADLRRWLESTPPSALEPDLRRSRAATLAILESTPAVLPKFLRPLTDDDCRHEPTRDDWAMNEIVCHLRDTEREVHSLQIDLMLEKDDAFIPRPDTAVWASERDYLNEDPIKALQEFSSARVDLITKIKNLPDEIWNRKVKHAIFGPSSFSEVVGFAADHDRMHLQQARKTTLQTLAAKRVQSASRVL